MIKKILIAVIFLILLAGAGLFFYFGSLAKSGIEVVGSSVLGTSVSVEGVSVSPLSGAGSISGLRVENPEGFNSQYAFELDSVSVNINTSTFFSDVLEIESITIVQPTITYETKITTDNIRTLLAHLSSGDSTAGRGSSSSDEEKQIIIRELRILDSQLNFVAAVVTAPIFLADIEMQDIGTDGGSISIADAVRMILAELSYSILDSDLPSIDSLRESAEGRLQEQVEDVVEEISGRLRGILN